MCTEWMGREGCGGGAVGGVLAEWVGRMLHRFLEDGHLIIHLSGAGGGVERGGVWQGLRPPAAKVRVGTGAVRVVRGWPA